MIEHNASENFYGLHPRSCRNKSEKKKALDSQEARKVHVLTENNVEKPPQVQEVDGVPCTNLLNSEEKIDDLVNAIAELKSQVSFYI